MLTIINRENFALKEIDKEFRNSFIAKPHNEISDAESWMLKTVGDAIRKRSSMHFWNDGCYSWFYNYPDVGRSVEQRVFLTANGILVFEDCEKNKMFRVVPL